MVREERRNDRDNGHGYSKGISGRKKEKERNCWMLDNWC